MRTLVIPDLHHNVGWVRPFLARTPHDEVVFLGDYFDDFGDGPEDALATAMWLRDAIEIPNAVFLMGNHDIPYRFPEVDFLHCPGFDDAKCRAVAPILDSEAWARFRLFHASQGWIISHAGVSVDVFGHPHQGWSAETIAAVCDEALAKAHERQPHRALAWGVDRGGPDRFGGITWQCWSSFRPILGWNQIVGHTPGHRVRRKQGPDSDNYCIDTVCRHAAIIEEGSVAIIPTGVRHARSR